MRINTADAATCHSQKTALNFVTAGQIRAAETAIRQLDGDHLIDKLGAEQPLQHIEVA
jgi:hypothetical protein